MCIRDRLEEGSSATSGPSNTNENVGTNRGNTAVKEEAEVDVPDDYTTPVELQYDEGKFRSQIDPGKTSYRCNENEVAYVQNAFKYFQSTVFQSFGLNLPNELINIFEKLPAKSVAKVIGTATQNKDNRSIVDLLHTLVYEEILEFQALHIVKPEINPADEPCAGVTTACLLYTSDAADE